jgi:hypothetical protein
MAVGSAFDGLVKNAIERINGMPIRDYLGQIEHENRAQALEDGKQVMDFYSASKGISRLLISGVPRMEFEIKCPIPGTEACVGGPVIIMGKPDLYYRVGGLRIVHDWKVNGYCSSASPQKGYVWDSKTGAPHKEVSPRAVRQGDTVTLVGQSAHFGWLDQLITYGWGLGEPVGEEFCLQVHQITRTPAGGPLRLTEHRCLAAPDYQRSLRDRYAGCWEAIKSGRVFTDLDLEADYAEQKSLDLLARGMTDDAFNMVCGR